ncbi:tRNA uridine-5-carboxymethylaminomethyl(34) synthesis GTPase MnmE [Colwellia sp. BRX8-7]|uniref:tRNA uridine-5-carboxymethylaminomethyl(34) synthesis GTPase MnmE n=1 Tax=unclassified Colwellia TaxID=196834 RepID=UPI0015F3BE66|nr:MULTISPECIES: tRNA uridine-5-carboxymethylaminomethyl(34) synthesis GTPase MnmE [unclassified Colwellia]MBA6364898.1 tRNA uridine-5-carboxymethylaminomethyl(34) synthesis GTPase MnmE [Colwellia sp. BRX8-8]MBA6338278.1 tRNA uridine-5-carboxymethylaminomethyl(34) synthesis GTPase MnmE [Colwellia sp. BRX8-7]MBA6347770.1 tRNA uridine-5-carboxymethylaminomethyl(34) synthesis GTPase MnmE [Colwellia sp. BRX8-9]MBA6351763.1 tRNA uridine-5-carboxymethylaminomethyl(34) synthesis GTPase MnmE [Colwellia
MTEILYQKETIAAQATAPGRGGVGIIRISGPEVKSVAQAILGKIPEIRKAEYLPFNDANQQTLDQGIALYFKAPHSFTGEDVLELQGHGGPVILDMLLKEILALPKVRMAKPGEFSEQAFINDKLDLTQAEAIADLINSSSEQAARCALHSLQGDFSKLVNQLVESTIHLRMYVEAAIDFPEEEIDFLADEKVVGDLKKIISQVEKVQSQAHQGSIIREGMRVVIAGRPNAGKSSLLNALSGREAAIVTDIAGTTRDVLTEQIHIDGMPLHIIDTAGLRESNDQVEQIGIERAWQEINQADRVLLMIDACDDNNDDPQKLWPEFFAKLPKNIGLSIIKNKADIKGIATGLSATNDIPTVTLSAKNGDGIAELKDHLKSIMGYQGSTEGGFMARRRHLAALEQAHHHLIIGLEQLESYVAGEILAEELRLCQIELNKITGEFTNDDLLTEIFSSFCIGK